MGDDKSVKCNVCEDTLLRVEKGGDINAFYACSRCDPLAVAKNKEGLSNPNEKECLPQIPRNQETNCH